MNPSVEEGFFVQVAVTNRCNLSCRHCYREVRKPYPSEFTTEELVGLFHQIRSLAQYLGRSPHLVLSGGEPLTRHDVGLLIQVAESMGIAADLNTNATLIEKEMAMALRQWGLNTVQVSLDGPSPEPHDAIRGPTNFHRAVSGIRHLLNQGMEVMIKVTLMPDHNTDQIPAFYSLANELGVQVLSFARLLPLGPGAKLSRWTPESYQEVLEAMGREAMKSPRTRTEIRDAGFNRAFSLNYPHLFQSEEGISFLAIDAEGTVLAGRRAPVVVGNVREHSLESIWQHPILQALRERQIKGKCATCELFEVCGGGSRAAAFAETGDILAPDPHCWYEPSRDKLPQ